MMKDTIEFSWACMSRYFWLILLICLHATKAFAAVKYDKLWGVFSYIGHYERLLYSVEPQLRLVNRSEVLEQFLYNTGLGYQLNPELQVWLGQTFSNFAGSNELAEDVAINDVTEYRLWQQTFWRHSQKWGEIQFRTRLEERYSLEYSPWSLRLRPRPGIIFNLTEHQALVILDELFLNLKQVSWVETKTLDQNRISFGIMQRLNATTSFTISYFNQTIFRNPTQSNDGVLINILIQQN
jgi:hypothetical protein